MTTTPPPTRCSSGSRGSTVTADAPVWSVGGAAFVALVALIVALITAVRLRRLRQAQMVLLPSGTSIDSVQRQAALEDEITALKGALADAHERTTMLAADLDIALTTALRYTGLERYDAYGDLGGHQSWSVAAVDASGTGLVISTLVGRDDTRVYAKHLSDGRSELPLSDEEQRALSQAHSHAGNDERR